MTMMSPDLRQTTPLRSVRMVSLLARPENDAIILALGTVLLGVALGDLPKELAFLGLSRGELSASCLLGFSPLTFLLELSFLFGVSRTRLLVLTTLTSPREVRLFNVSEALLSGMNLRVVVSLPCFIAAA